MAVWVVVWRRALCIAGMIAASRATADRGPHAPRIVGVLLLSHAPPASLRPPRATVSALVESAHIAFQHCLTLRLAGICLSATFRHLDVNTP
jgi:hypothetical protein